MKGVFALLCIWPVLLLAELSDAEYEDLKDLASQFPESASTLVVGVGRSPTPLTAYLKNTLGEKNVVTLPLSGVRVTSKGLPEWQEGEIKELLSHVEKFLPVELLAKYKRVRIVDYSTSGRSIRAAGHILEAYMQKKGISKEIDLVPIVSDYKIEQVREKAADGGQKIHPVVLRVHSKLESGMELQSYDQYAPYHKYMAYAGLMVAARDHMHPQNIRQEYTEFEADIRRRYREEHRAQFWKSCHDMFAAVWQLKN